MTLLILIFLKFKKTKNTIKELNLLFLQEGLEVKLQAEEDIVLNMDKRAKRLLVTLATSLSNVLIACSSVFLNVICRFTLPPLICISVSTFEIVGRIVESVSRKESKSN